MRLRNQLAQVQAQAEPSGRTLPRAVGAVERFRQVRQVLVGHAEAEVAHAQLQLTIGVAGPKLSGVGFRPPVRRWTRRASSSWCRRTAISNSPATTSCASNATSRRLPIVRSRCGMCCWPASTILAAVLPHEGMLPVGLLSFRLSSLPLQWSKAVGMWSKAAAVGNAAAQRRVVHGRRRCAAGASSTCP
jgi:hypothetical protein